MIKKKKRRRFFLFKALVFLIFALGALGATGAAGYVFLSRSLPNPAQFNSRQIIQSTKIYDRAGKTLLYEIHGEEKRTVIPFERIPEHARNATIAIEDANFYHHPAFDWRSIIRALAVDITTRQVAQGGSTITQQLAKNAFLSPERTLTRKIRELVLALQLERLYSKDEILALYLNQVPYGANAYGIEAASQTYFNKSANELNLAEAALLASLPKAPSYYSPWGAHTDELEKRKNYIIQRMKDLGYIDEEERERTQKTKLTFAPDTTSIKAPHFVLMVRDYLNSRYGEELVEKGGLKVITALDVPLQELAEKVVAEGAKRNQELYQGKNAALVAQDAKTGQVLALVGSRDYFDKEIDGNFNVATQGLRQPGSAFKPFAYITAFKRGFTPETVVFDVPTEFAANNPDCPLVDFNKPFGAVQDASQKENDECYHPENFDERFRGAVTFREALAQSINIPSVKALYLAGMDNTLAVAHQFGITTLNERSRYGLSLVLGGGEIKLIDLVGAYSVFSQEGVKHRQSLILKIEDPAGKVLEEYQDQAEPVIEPQYAKMINDILSDKEARLPLFANSIDLTVFPNQEVALKTGTTNDYRDAWTLGYTPSLVVGVWAGNNDNLPMQKKGSSILAAIPIWNAFMKEVLKDRSVETFNSPDPITVEKPILRGEKIVKQIVYLDTRTGQPATPETPTAFILKKEYPQIHSILYYIDKNNPAGPAPEHPENDSQFPNWEESVLHWARQNYFDFSVNYNLTPPAQNAALNQEGFKPKISDFSPKNGGFISENNVEIKAVINANFELYKVEAYFNNQLIDQKLGTLGRNLQYNYSFKPSQVGLQNTILLKAWDIFNNQTEYQVIVYK